jgi:hypothetical protein
MTPRPVACGPAPVTRLPGPVPGTCFVGPLSPWPPSLAPPAPRRITPLCSSASLLLRRSQTSRVRASSASTPRLPDADLGAFALRPNPRSPGSRAKSFHTCQGLRPRRAGRALAITRPSMSPSVFMTTSAPETILLSRLNGWPMHSPVNASSASSRIPTHDSGPMRFATPSSQRTFTAYSLPVSTGAPTGKNNLCLAPSRSRVIRAAAARRAKPAPWSASPSPRAPIAPSRRHETRCRSPRDRIVTIHRAVVGHGSTPAAFAGLPAA